MRFALILAAALALSACVSHNPSEGARVSFRCEGGKVFSYRRVEPAIEVFASGTTHRLEPVGDGQFRSPNGAVTYAESGGRATLAGVYNGPFENCQRRARLTRLF
jgi:hypothetical protein